MEQPGIADEKYEQRIAALEKAQKRRKQKAVMRKAMATGVVSDLDVLRGDSEYEGMVAEWPALRLLKLMPRIGESRAYEVCVHGDITPRTKLGKLTYEKRAQLARHVEEARDGWKP